MSPVGAHRGPPQGEGSNRARILAAGRHEFGAKGFRGATMRSIAAEAGVDVALLAHYFGNKDGLFAATLELPAGAHRLLAEALSAPGPEQGERLARGYLGLWEDPATREQMHVLTRSVLSNEVASERLRGLVTGTISGPEVTELLVGRRAGFTLAMAQLVGAAVVRYLAQVPPLADLDVDEVVARLAPAVQQHLDSADREATS